jgi:hypothetical protein
MLADMFPQPFLADATAAAVAPKAAMNAFFDGARR